MSRKRKPFPIFENVTIEAVAAEGKCVAHVEDKVVFVPFVVPGDVVRLTSSEEENVVIARLPSFDLSARAMCVKNLCANTLVSVADVNGRTYLTANN